MPPQSAVDELELFIGGTLPIHSSDGTKCAGSGRFREWKPPPSASEPASVGNRSPSDNIGPVATFGTRKALRSRSLDVRHTGPDRHPWVDSDFDPKLATQMRYACELRAS